MQRRRTGFLLPGLVLTALACIGVTVLIMSAAGVLPNELPVLRSAGSGGPRRQASVPAPAPTTRPPSATPSATASPSPTRSVSASPSATVRPSSGPTATSRPTPSVTPTVTRSPTTPPPPACKPGSATARPVADAYLDQEDPTRNHGADDTLQVGSRDRSRNRRAVLRFPAFTAPKGCRVTGGTLTMKALQASGRRLLVAPATKAWDEGTVNWSNGPWPTGTATGATVSSATVVWALPASTVTSAHGLVVYDAAENARGDGEQTNLASRTARGAPTLVIRWS